ncbi:hypothetical protein MKX01_007605 [Papaver californicum]|nr:hypothetical protein MKX01_007605 [Papaver californicum]
MITFLFRYSWFPSAKGVLWGLIGANVAVFMLWRVSDLDVVHTMITSAFSQIDIEHLFSNMLGLYFFGKSIGQIFGPQFLLKLYLAGAIGGSIFYLVHHAFMHPLKNGAVNAIVLLEIFLFPKATLYFNFFIPVPAILLVSSISPIYTSPNYGKTIYAADGHISGEAHLGGATVAAIAWAGVKRGWWV